ncbi:MAG TPA: hypothetical protein VFL57_02525 [Bryobacteraceae bacterium]|nr:hypothetical protein [Bryobacteraceae bacterium]
MANRRAPGKRQSGTGARMRIGVAWYHREDYLRLKAMFTDGENLPDTFDDWQKIVRRSGETLRGDGFEIVKAYIDPKVFSEWCRARGMEMNARARTTYAAEFARFGHAPPA